MDTDGSPLISVLIPSYNHARYMPQALDSVLADPYPNKEIVVVNDGSTDNTDEVIRQWRAAHAEEISITHRTRPNAGICRTLNEASSLAAGQYLAILASDDLLIGNGIQLRYTYLRAHPDKLAVIGDSIVIDAEGRRISGSVLFDYHHGIRELFNSEAGIRKQFIEHWCFAGPCLMVHRDIFSRIGPFDEQLRYEDWDFFLRMSAAGIIGFVDVPVGAYRIHSRNTSAASRFVDGSVEEFSFVARKNLHLFPVRDRIQLALRHIYLSPLRQRIRTLAQRSPITRWLVPLAQAALRFLRGIRSQKRRTG